MYIGNSPANVGNFQVVDDISSTFNGTLTSFALTASSLAINPAKSGQLLVSINGVLQEPDDTGTEGFKVSGSNIVFSSAPATGSTFWAVWQGQAVDIGTPSDGTVGTAQMSSAELALTGGLSLGDNVKAKFGASDDLEIYHDGANSYVSDTGTGNLVLLSEGSNIQLASSPYEVMLAAHKDGAVALYHNNEVKLATTATGIDVTGSVTCDGLGLDNSQYISLKNSSNVSTRSFGINSANNMYIGGVDAAIGSTLFVNNGAEVMRINSSGNVGIGTSSPSRSLHITSNANTPTLRLSSGSTYTADYGPSIEFQNGTVELLAGVKGAFEQSSNGNYGVLIFSTRTSDALGIEEKMRITSAGKVGIGTSSPANLLHLDSGTGPTAWARFENSTNSGLIGYDNADAWLFYNGSSESMRIDSAGNVGIGTVSPSAKLQSSSNTFNPSTTTTGNPAIASQGAYGGAICLIDTKQSGMYAFNSGTRVAFFTGRVNGTHTATSKINMTMSDNGCVGFGVNSPTVRIHLAGGTATSANTGIAAAWNVHSDYRMKENIVPLIDATERLKKLNPVRFNWNFEDGTPAVDGFIAHEAGEVVPEAVSGTKDAMRDEEYEVTPAVMDGDTVVTEAVMGTRSVPDYQGIDQSKLVPLLAASLQEAVAKIEALEARVTALEPTDEPTGE